MARTKKLNQAQLMLQAGQSGESAKQRAHESMASTANQQANRAEQARQGDADRGLRANQINNAARQQRDAQRAANQAAKPRTTNFGGEAEIVISMH